MKSQHEFVLYNYTFSNKQAISGKVKSNSLKDLKVCRFSTHNEGLAERKLATFIETGEAQFQSKTQIVTANSRVCECQVIKVSDAEETEFVWYTACHNSSSSWRPLL